MSGECLPEFLLLTQGWDRKAYTICKTLFPLTDVGGHHPGMALHSATPELLHGMGCGASKWCVAISAKRRSEQDQSGQDQTDLDHSNCLWALQLWHCLFGTSYSTSVWVCLPAFNQQQMEPFHHASAFQRGKQGTWASKVFTPPIACKMWEANPNRGRKP